MFKIESVYSYLKYSVFYFRVQKAMILKNENTHGSIFNNIEIHQFLNSYNKISFKFTFIYITLVS